MPLKHLPNDWLSKEVMGFSKNTKVLYSRKVNWFYPYFTWLPFMTFLFIFLALRWALTSRCSILPLPNFKGPFWPLLNLTQHKIGGGVISDFQATYHQKSNTFIFKYTKLVYSCNHKPHMFLVARYIGKRDFSSCYLRETADFIGEDSYNQWARIL